jgi:hypothetical protein
MKEMYVSIPIAGSVLFVVDAEDEASAIEAAWAEFEENGVDDSTLEYEVLERICEGNVCYAPLNNVEVDIPE